MILKTSQDPLWTRGFIFAIGANFFLSMVFYLLMTTMAFYAVQQFNTSETIGGLTTGSFIIGGLMGRIVTGKYLDFVGRRRTLLIALIGFVLTGLAYIVIPDVWLLILVRTLHGACFGTASSALNASVMMLLPPLRRGEGTGYFGLSTTLSAAVGPALAVFAIDNISFTALFLLSAASGFFSLLLAIFLMLPERALSDTERAGIHRWRFNDIVDPGALPIAIINGIAGLAFASILAFINSFAQAEGLSAGLFFVVYAGAMFLGRLTLGRVQDYYGDNVVSYPTMISYVVSFVVLANASANWHIIVAAILAGLGFGTFMPMFQAIAITQAPDHRVAVTTSTFYIILDIGTGFGPVLAGVIVTWFGYSGMYLVMAAIMVCATIAYHFVHGHKRYVRRLHYKNDA